MKKVLIIIENARNMESKRNTLINEFVELKRAKGHKVDVIGDENGVLRGLLDEEELWGKEITSAQADVMFDLNRYEVVLFVSQLAKETQDVMVYDPEQLDKNMIFYNIGNMSIVKKMKQEEGIRVESDKATDDQSPEEEMTAQEEVLGDGTVGDNNSYNANDSSVGDGLLSGDEDTFEREAVSLGTASERDDSKQEGVALEHLDVENSKDEVMVANQATDTFDELELADVTSSELLSIGEEVAIELPKGIEESAHNSYVLVDRDHENQEIPLSVDEELEEAYNNRERRGRISWSRRLWLIVPWVLMGLMSFLAYEKITWIPFILSVFGFFVTAISNRKIRADKTAEWLSVWMTMVALIVSFVWNSWILSIAMPLSAMGIVLFLIIGSVDWES